MSNPLSQEALASAFAELGVPDPESWAKFELSNETPHLARMSVLRSLWNCVSVDDDGTQLKQQIEQPLRTTRDYPTTRHLLAHCVDRGVTPAVLAQLVRSVEIDLLQRVTYELDGGEIAPSVPEIEWAIFQIGEDGQPFGPALENLPAAFIMLDPADREGGPRDVIYPSGWSAT
jgi:hypothetical protein